MGQSQAKVVYFQSGTSRLIEKVIDFTGWYCVNNDLVMNHIEPYSVISITLLPSKVAD